MVCFIQPTTPEPKQPLPRFIVVAQFHREDGPLKLIFGVGRAEEPAEKAVTGGVEPKAGLTIDDKELRRRLAFGASFQIVTLARRLEWQFLNQGKELCPHCSGLGIELAPEVPFVVNCQCGIPAQDPKRFPILLQCGGDTLPEELRHWLEDQPGVVLLDAPDPFDKSSDD
jgi:hypothetical protein